MVIKRVLKDLMRQLGAMDSVRLWKLLLGGLSAAEDSCIQIWVYEYEYKTMAEFLGQ
jgi:hypothetical protein